MSVVALIIIDRNGEGYVVRASGRVENLVDIEEIVVATRGAVPVRIRDVADVTHRPRAANRQRQRRMGARSCSGQP